MEDSLTMVIHEGQVVTLHERIELIVFYLRMCISIAYVAPWEYIGILEYIGIYWNVGMLHELFVPVISVVTKDPATLVPGFGTAVAIVNVTPALTYSTLVPGFGTAVDLFNALNSKYLPLG